VKSTLILKGGDDVEMLRQIEAFRLEVWNRLVDSETAYTRFCLDRFDYDGWHIVLMNEANIIGSGRIIIASDESGVPDLCSFRPYAKSMNFPIGIMNRLVVHWQHANDGVGRQINLERVEIANNQGVSEVWVEIQVPRVASMEQLGFRDMGPSQDTSIVGVWRIMRKTISLCFVK